MFPSGGGGSWSKVWSSSCHRLQPPREGIGENKSKFNPACAGDTQTREPGQSQGNGKPEAPGSHRRSRSRARRSVRSAGGPDKKERGSSPASGPREVMGRGWQGCGSSEEHRGLHAPGGAMMQVQSAPSDTPGADTHSGRNRGQRSPVSLQQVKCVAGSFPTGKTAGLGAGGGAGSLPRGRTWGALPNSRGGNKTHSTQTHSEPSEGWECLLPAGRCPLKPGTRRGRLFPKLLFNTVVRVPASAMRREGAGPGRKERGRGPSHGNRTIHGGNWPNLETQESEVGKVARHRSRTKPKPKPKQTNERTPAGNVGE